jgi:hypothetical protein
MPSLKVDTATSGANTLLTGVANQKFRVYGYLLVAAGAVTANVKSGSTSLTGAMSLITGTPLSAWSPVAEGQRNPVLETASGDDLVLTLGGAVQVSGHLLYEQVSA